MLNAIKTHAVNAEQNDDITILCCKLTLNDDISPDCELVMRNDTAGREEVPPMYKLC